MTNPSLDLTEILLSAAAVPEAEFVAEHPHPVLVPEKVYSGLLREIRKDDGTGTMALGQRELGRSMQVDSGRVLVVRKEALGGRLDRFDKAHSLGTWISLGRQADSEVMVNDFSVSKRHARIRRHQDGFEIQDLGSSNGTCLNGTKLPPEVPTQLESGDRIRLGRVELLFLGPVDLYRLLRP